jgi:hypothetical protein
MITSLRILSNSTFIDHMSIWYHMVWDDENVIKLTFIDHALHFSTQILVPWTETWLHLPNSPCSCS